MQLLKQSTAATLKIGPFLDSTDGITAETGLTISQADVRLSKNGGNIAQKNEASACTHDELGYYDCDVDATDTATLGRLLLAVSESGACPVWHEYMVVTANIYDSLCSTEHFDVNVAEISDDSAAADNLESACDNYSVTRGLSGTALPAAAADAAGGLPISDAGGLDMDAILEDTAEIGAAGAGLTAVPWNASWDAEVQSECADALAAINLDHLLYQPVSDESNLGDGGGNEVVASTIMSLILASDNDADGFNYTTDSLEAIRDKLTDIEADTNELQTDDIPGTLATIDGKIDTIDGIVDDIVADTNELQTDDIPGTLATMDGKIDTIDGIVDDIVADTNELQTDDVPGLIGALNDISAADVNTQVSDVMKTDTISEMSQGAPTATPTFEEAVMYLYMALRNRADANTSGTPDYKIFYNDAGTAIWKKAITDDGSDYSEAKGISGA